jgi:hypothetical protein
VENWVRRELGSWRVGFVENWVRRELGSWRVGFVENWVRRELGSWRVGFVKSWVHKELGSRRVGFAVCRHGRSTQNLWPSFSRTTYVEDTVGHSVLTCLNAALSVSGWPSRACSTLLVCCTFHFSTLVPSQPFKPSLVKVDLQRASVHLMSVFCQINISPDVCWMCK